jgi:hypothetical protein
LGYLTPLEYKRAWCEGPAHRAETNVAT